MNYRINPMGELWQSGTFCLPKNIVKNYIKLASEYQLKTILMIFANDGIGSSKSIAKTLGCTESDVDDFLEFWVEEGVLLKADETTAAVNTSETADIVKTPTESVEKSAPAEASQPKTKAVEALPVPTLSPKDIVAMCRDSQQLTMLLRTAQEVLGKTLSHANQEMILNMVTYYGLPEEVVLTILSYYKSEKEKGRAIGAAYISAMAKNWADEGITTLTAADEKLKELESSDKLWSEIIALTGIRHRNPTIKQRDMIKAWADAFDMQMISLACDIMKENTEKPTLNYVDKVLRSWQKKGLKTPADVEADNESYNSKKEKENAKAIDRIESKPTYDIAEIERRAMYDDDYDV